MAKPSLTANVSLSLSSWFFLRQFSSIPSRLIPDAGTEKLAGVLLISGKTRQVPSRRVTVGGRGSKGLFSPSISLPLLSPSFCTLPSLSSYLPPPRRRFNNFDLWFWFYLRKPPNTSSKACSCRSISVSLLFVGIYLWLLSIMRDIPQLSSPFFYKLVTFLEEKSRDEFSI